MNQLSRPGGARSTHSQRQSAQVHGIFSAFRVGPGQAAPSARYRADTLFGVGRPPLPPPPLLDPAWYPDPTGRYEARYWDGRKWTSHISHYGATGSDPLLRARFDRWWLRGAFRVIFWAGLAGVAWWAFNEYWPTDERDLASDQALATNSVLVITDVPAAGWVVSSSSDLSPLALAVDEDGLVSVLACESMADVIDDSAAEPIRRQVFAAGDGTTTVAERTVVGANSGFGDDYLDALREPEAGACLSALWATAAQQQGDDLSVVSTMPMLDPSFGDEAVWWRMGGDTTAGALTVSSVVDVVVVRTDRVVSEYVFAGSPDGVPIDFQRQVVQAHTTRIRELLDAFDSAEDECDPLTEVCDTTPTPDPFGETGETDGE